MNKATYLARLRRYRQPELADVVRGLQTGGSRLQRYGFAAKIDKTLCQILASHEPALYARFNDDKAVYPVVLKVVLSDWREPKEPNMNERTAFCIIKDGGQHIIRDVAYSLYMNGVSCRFCVFEGVEFQVGEYR